ncbi:hypothetical protein [Stigmatella aurantiaca]|uniref:Conserved uncharacterized protein n=1 Tax=Stigmatella aurantiaca (strain DW4/3-1) TaxID=378806 RepID=Q098H4_STIAD|nr:hypothetical protein [Stigmatella aurantiaca]ADO68099.1 conserved uncharacterized protein [Stigmatella aurantiaca DW4/3-1]EAU68118.1 hypothetical protein STIAU_2710 [Stigmatella aurantiaca DW4/3-1]
MTSLPPTLHQQLEARAPELASSSVEWMYADPFWRARYGEERARRFGNEDALFHVRYLIQALQERRPSVMEGYAAWLRPLLVARGMCTRHLDQHFAGLQAALAASGFGLDSPAQAYVQAGRTALRYPEGLARSLQDATPALARTLLQTLTPELPLSIHPRLEEEALLQLSYLADAVGTGRPELFAQHASWYRAFWPQRALDRLSFQRFLEALDSALGAHFAPADLDTVRAVLAPARAAD